MNIFHYSHQGALDIFPLGERREIETAIATCSIPIERSAAPKIRKHLEKHLEQSGWPGEFQVEPPSRITIASLKNNVGLCIQTGGNMSRMYADLLKLQKLYMESRVKVGGFIMPSLKAAAELGDNVANADRLQAELTIFRKVIHMPIVIFSFD